MKTKHIFVAIVCLIVCVACQPTLENYRPMIVEGYQWNTIVELFYGSPDDGYLTEIWKIKGESSIDGKVYKQLWRSYKEDQSDAEMVGLLREDISDQKIYMYRDGKEVLLYDFGMKTGQKVKLYLCEYFYERPEEQEYYLELISINNRRDQANEIYREFHYDIYLRHLDEKDSEYEKVGTHITYERFGSQWNGIMPNNTSGLIGGAPTDILCAYDENGVVLLTSDESDREYAGYCFYTTTEGFH